MPPPSDRAKNPVGRPILKKNDADKPTTPTKASKAPAMDTTSEKGRTTRSQRQSASKAEALSQQQDRVTVQTKPTAADAAMEESMDVDDGTESEEENSEAPVEKVQLTDQSLQNLTDAVASALTEQLDVGMKKRLTRMHYATVLLQKKLLKVKVVFRRIQALTDEIPDILNEGEMKMLEPEGA